MTAPQDVDAARLEAMIAGAVGRRLAALAAVARAFGRPAPGDGEAARLAMARGAAVPPGRCGPEVPVAPARGRVVAMPTLAVQPTATGWEVQPAGFAGRDAARAADVWDRMADQARRAGGARPFTARQVQAGRTYAALVERHAARGLRGVSIETMLAGRSGGAGGGHTDAVLAEGRRIGALRAAADGAGLVALAPRGQAGRRRAVRVLALVDAVAVAGQSLSEVLRAHGWAVKSETLKILREALALALDRMADATG